MYQITMDIAMNHVDEILNISSENKTKNVTFQDVSSNNIVNFSFSENSDNVVPTLFLLEECLSTINNSQEMMKERERLNRSEDSKTDQNGSK